MSESKGEVMSDKREMTNTLLGIKDLADRIKSSRIIGDARADARVILVLAREALDSLGSEPEPEPMPEAMPECPVCGHNREVAATRFRAGATHVCFSRTSTSPHWFAQRDVWRS